MKVLGIDPSLTGTGLAVVNTSNAPVVAFTETVTTGMRGHERLQRILSEVNEWLGAVDVVVIEGPSYGSHSAAQRGHHERAGLWWLITHEMCWRRRRLPYVVVAPRGRALYATGKGNAAKDAVLIAVTQRYPKAQVANNNEADALILAAMAVDHYGHPLVVVPQTHRAALDKVTWPDLPIAPTRGVA